MTSNLVSLRLSADYYEFGYCQPVQTAELIANCPFQTAFEQPKIKNWAVNQFLTVPIAQIIAEGFHEDGRATTD